MAHIVFIDSTIMGFNGFKTAKRLGHEVTFIRPMDAHSYVNMLLKDSQKLQPYLAYIDHYIEVDNLEPATLDPVLDALAKDHPFDAAVSTCETGIIPASLVSERFGLLYPTHAALCNAVFKDRCRAVLAEHGIRSPRFEVLNETALAQGPRGIALPFVVKPVRGFGKHYSAICHTRQDYDNFLLGLEASRELSAAADWICSREYIIEEYVVGSLHSAEVVVRDGEVMVYATTTRLRAHYYDLLELAAVMPSGLPDPQRAEIKSYLQSVFSALKVHVGLYHVELLMSASGPVLVEINARMMGSVSPNMYEMLTDRDAYQHMLDVHLGKPVALTDTGFGQAGITLAVAARHGGRVRADFRPEQLTALLAKYGIPLTTLNLAAGQEIGRYEGNLSIMGHIICLDSDPAAVTRKGHAFLCEIDQLIGIETAKYLAP